MEKRIMEIAENALYEVLTQAGFGDDGSFEKSCLQSVYDNLGVEKTETWGVEELFESYYGWFKDALANNDRYYVWTTNGDDEYFEESYEDYDEAVASAKSIGGVVRYKFTIYGYEQEDFN